MELIIKEELDKIRFLRYQKDRYMVNLVTKLIVYTEEIYTHRNYFHYKNSLHDTNDKYDLQVTRLRKDIR